MNLSLVEIKAFVPTRDFHAAIAFYKAIGFEVPWHDDELAYCRFEHTSFFLQNFYVEAHAQNFMMHLQVQDADAWHAWLTQERIAERFGVRIDDPADRPWGMRDFVLFDPTGVLWRVGHNLPKKMES